MSTVIKVENISKLYRLGQIGSHTLSKDLSRWWARLRGKEDPFAKIGTSNVLSQKSNAEYVWSLKDVSFEVKEGEVLGIVGKNGAGKSTLLKILSRVTAPTTGSVKVKGRIASLLEVGTGFHPELSGIENIFLNGAILGMTKAEIKRKLDEIVDFSGISQYIDTPVKRYSSGMYVRLAFAVAAHLEPEILIVDEVLAVGDMEFQKKCLGKMKDVSQTGRTVLFVSHNMGAVRTLCNRAIMLKEGQVEIEADTNQVIEHYLFESNFANSHAEKEFPLSAEKDFQVRKAMLLNEKGQKTDNFIADEPIIIDLITEVKKPIPGLYGYMTLSNAEGIVALESDSLDFPPNYLDGLKAGSRQVRIKIPSRLLAPGKYSVYLNFTSKSNLNGWNVDSPGTVLSFQVSDDLTTRGNNRVGFFSSVLKWDLVN